VREPDLAPLAAPLQEEDVAAVGVYVHLLGVEGEQTELGTHRRRAVGSFSGRFWALSRTTVESASLGPLSIERRPIGSRPAIRASASSSGAVSRVSRSSWTLRSTSPAGETRSRRRFTSSSLRSDATHSGRLE